MPDREKVIKGMEMCISPVECSPDECPYYIRPNNESGLCWDRLMTDALSLLKEQDAVMPKVSSVEQRCGNCNKIIEMDGWKSCPWCGKSIDWERWWSKNGAYDNA